MDAWDKSLTWGLGGDQVRILDRKVESLLLAAEVFDAAASSLGAASQCDLLDKAWRDELASQSHDVGLCESSRWQGDLMAPADRLEDKHNFTWGAIGYNHLDAAQKQGQQVLDAAMAHLAKQIGSAAQAHGPLAATVFNPHGWPRTDLAATGRIYPVPADTKDIVVKDSSGQHAALADRQERERRPGQHHRRQCGVSGERSAVGGLRHLLHRLRAASRGVGQNGSAASTRRS